MAIPPELPPAAFTKQDTGDDLAFYAPPRLVTHIDEVATAALTAWYDANLPSGGVILDMMSSWVSHLPKDFAPSEVIGHGMNADELRANPRLTRWFIQNLNRDPVLPLADASCDAVLCCVGVQYLQQPVAVFADVARVLRRSKAGTGGLVAVSFSNRCFPTKAVAIWRSLDLSGQAGLVHHYLERAGFEGVNAQALSDGRAGDPLILVSGRVPTA